jgi:TRAP-type C4-dicarboxylate transport system permease small subunit
VEAIQIAAPAAPRGGMRWVDAAVDIVVGVALVGELLVVMGNVLGRLFFNEPLLWGDEAAGFALSIIAFRAARSRIGATRTCACKP